MEEKVEVERNKEEGSIELIVLGLLAALIVVLAIPYLVNIGQKGEQAFSRLSDNLNVAIQ